MKFTNVISAFCLWQATSAIPVEPHTKSSHTMVLKDTHDDYTLKSAAHGHKHIHDTHLDAPKRARCGGAPDTSSTAPPPSSTTFVTSVQPSQSASGTVTSAPVSGSATSGAPTYAYCKAANSTFVDATVADSPPAIDCAGIAGHTIPALVAKGMTSWTYTRADWAQSNTTGIKNLASNGACAFGVSVGTMKTDSIQIGTLDAQAVIREAVVRFAQAAASVASAGPGALTRQVFHEMPANSTTGTEGKMDVAGAFACGDAGTVVNWALYHA
ncbi:hypothetical protein F5Y04DRAFT_284790 [Hypomontagnella monticulosa]|nr:hypothetical protein F5Y04DRAFT_284790 [Hypomontagnella monticulosa]